MGPLNYLASNYMGIPISITVEGANILTRNFNDFLARVQHASHPYVLAEMEAAADSDEEAGLRSFDQLLIKHIASPSVMYSRVVWHGLTGARFANAPVGGETIRYYQQLSRHESGVGVMCRRCDVDHGVATLSAKK